MGDAERNPLVHANELLVGVLIPPRGTGDQLYIVEWSAHHRLLLHRPGVRSSRSPRLHVYAEVMPKLVGMNHIALEVDDIDEALAFWESIFGELTLRGRNGHMAFIDMGDQFIALVRGRTQPPPVR